MSYTPDSQLLKPSVTKIIEGIEEFSDTVDARVRDIGEWTSEHLYEIVELQIALVRIRLRLTQLMKENR